MVKRYVLAATAILLATEGAALAQATAPLPEPPAVTPQRIVENPCKSGELDDILVCGRRQAIDAYRLPLEKDGYDPWGETDSVSRERHRLLGPESAGNGSCTTVGPAGWTGCDVARIKSAEQMGREIGIGGRIGVGVQVGRKSYGIEER